MRIDAYCLMGNHFHLVIQTPQANLVAGRVDGGGIAPVAQGRSGETGGCHTVAAGGDNDVEMDRPTAGDKRVDAPEPPPLRATQGPAKETELKKLGTDPVLAVVFAWQPPLALQTA